MQRTELMNTIQELSLVVALVVASSRCVEEGVPAFAM